MAKDIQSKMRMRDPQGLKNSVFTPNSTLDDHHKDHEESEEKLRRCKGKKVEITSVCDEIDERLEFIDELVQKKQDQLSKLSKELSQISLKEVQTQFKKITTLKQG